MSAPWPIKTLGEVAEIIMGQAPPGSDCNKDGHGTPFVKVAHFSETHPEISEWTTNPRKFAQESDVLICVVGNCGQLNLGSDCAIGRSVAAIRPNQSIISQKFLYYLLSQFSQFIEKMSQGAAQKVLRKNQILEIEITLPPLDEQDNIVKLLDDISERITSSTRKIKKARNACLELVEAKLQTVFEQESRGWEKIPFEKSTVKVNASPKIKRRDFKQKGLYPIISQEMSYINGFWDSADDLLLIGSPVVVFGDHTKTLKYVDFNFVRGADGLKVLKPIESIHPKFFYHQLRSVKLESLGYARHFRLLKQIDIRVPNMEVQIQIASLFDALDEQISDLIVLFDLELESLHELKLSMLQEAFNGNL